MERNRLKEWLYTAKNALALCLLALWPAAMSAQTGTWRSFMSYQEPQQIEDAGDMLFVRASNGLYAYNLNDQSIETFDKVKQLNDTYIKLIAWNAAAKRLIVVYQNSNIDIVDKSANVVNLSALYKKSMTYDKTVNNVLSHQQYVFLATGFGVVKVNMQRAEVSETYLLNHNTINIGVADGQLYINTKDTYSYVDYNVDNSTLAQGKVLSETIDEYTGTGANKKPSKKTVVIEGNYTGDLTKNLIDPSNWNFTETVPAGVYDKDLTAWNKYIDQVKTLSPGGPKYNHFGSMTLVGNKLYTVGGGWDSLGDLQRPGTVQVYSLDDDEWTHLYDDFSYISAEQRNWSFIDMMAVSVDPTDTKRVITSGRVGMFEYYDGDFVEWWQKDNSLLKNAIVSSSYRFILALGNVFDREGNLWCASSQTNGENLVCYTHDRQWEAHSQPELYTYNNDRKENVSLTKMTNMFLDSRGYIWFVNSHWENPAIFCYDPKSDRIITAVFSIVNEDGVSYKEYQPMCIAEDLDGSIWIGTNIGPFVIEPERIGEKDTYLTQVKVPRNDGTNYADYLMSGAVVSSIVVDGGGRKWMGTQSGLYLISADNMTQLQHFTTENSPLLSDNIESLAINNETGQLFIGTENGLCSFMSDATETATEMVKENVYAYPNPVVSGYDGMISVVGLTLDADVKILTTSGQLVAQGRSNGGMFTWNGRDRAGRRVASGIYMVATATSDGKKGTVCKIAVVK